MPEPGLSDFAAARGLDFAEVETVRPLTPALVGAARSGPVSRASGLLAPGLEGAILLIGGVRGASTVILTRVGASAAFLPALACRDRAASGGGRPSELELLFDPVWRGAGLARPLFNHLFAGMEVDLVWPALRMVAELDSQRFHGDWEAAARDRDRDQRLALAGWTCHRFVRRVVASDPTGTAERLRLLAGRAAAGLSHSV